MNPFNNRKFRQGSMATIITALVIALIVIINMVATTLSERYSLILDLTPNKAFSLSKDSIDLLASIDKGVTVYVLSSEEEFSAANVYFSQANEVIKRYSQHNQNITIVYRDIIKDPTFATKYPSLTLASGDILLECEGRTAVLTPYDLFNIESDYYSGNTVLASSKAEQAMSSALLSVTSDKTITVTVLGGHNEADITTFTDLLSMNNFNIIYQNLMTDPEIDPEATIAILAAPTRDISEDEAKKLDRFLLNEGKLDKTFFYLASSSQTTDMPVLDAFLSEWGIKVNPGVVFETNQSKLFVLDYFATIPDYSEDVYSENVASRLLPMASPASRPLERLYEEKMSKLTSELLAFSSTAGVMPPDAATDWTPSQTDTSGPIPAMLLSANRGVKEDGSQVQSNVLVGGSVDMLGSYVIGNINLANSDYMLNVLNKLVGRDIEIQIQSKTLGGTELGITGAQVIYIAVALAIVFPLIVLVFGLVTWLRRRHK